MRPESVWQFLSQATCTASVIGNRETHLMEGAFRAKLAGASHPILCANLKTKTGEPFLPSNLIFEINGQSIGVIGVSVPMVTDRMKSKAMSAFIWELPIPVAISEAKIIRPQVDLLIALTHIGVQNDRILAQKCPEIDIILGGHSHTILPKPEKVGQTWICQGGSHARFIGKYQWEDGELQGSLIDWKAKNGD